MTVRKAENFVLRDQDGNNFELYKNLDKNILLIFYPKDESLVCSRQLDNYQTDIDLFRSQGIQPVGINIEGVDSHKSFCSKLGIQFPILSDKDKKVSKRFKALNLFSVNKRKIVLLNTSAEIIYEKTVPAFMYENAGKILEHLRSKQII